MLNITMVDRACVNCGRKFRVSDSSKQTHCSANCRVESGEVTTKQIYCGGINSKKTKPARFTSEGKMIEIEVKSKTEPAPVVFPAVVETPVEEESLFESADEIYEFVESVGDGEMNKKDKIKIWRSCISSAKKIVKSMAQNRMEIAKLAIKACDINWGGGDHWSEHAGVHTVTKFASEIGISYKTLHSYIRTYRNVVNKIPSDIYDEDDYTSLIRTSNKVNSKTSAKEVVRIYKKEKSREGTNKLQLHTMIKKLSNVNFWFQSTDLSEFDKDDLIEMKYISKEIYNKLKDI